MLMRRLAGLTILSVILGACGEATSNEVHESSGGSGSGSVVAAGGASHGGASASSGGSSPTSGGSSPTSGGANGAGGAPIIVVHQGGADGSGGSAQVFPPFECRNAAPILEGGGYVQCGTGEYQRREVGVCTSKLPRPERNESRIDTECWVDAECTARAHGFCAWGSCRYGCVTDDECEAGRICFCGDPVGYCVPAACRSNADCSGGYPCYSLTPSQGFACQSPDGNCASSGHCPAGWPCGAGKPAGGPRGGPGCVPPPG